MANTPPRSFGLLHLRPPRSRRRQAGGDRPGQEDLGKLSWFLGCIGAWVVTFGALVASVPLIGDPKYLLGVGGLIVAAFPVAYYVHSSRVSRRLVNWSALGAAVVLGGIGLHLTWPPEGLRAYLPLHAAFCFLVKGFLWVMAFRAFAIRTHRDLVLSIIPAVSCVILVLVEPATVWAGIGSAAVVLGSLYLLASEYALEMRLSDRRSARVRDVAWELAPRHGPSLNTWQMIALVVVVVGAVVGAGASYVEFGGGVGQNIKRVLAQYLADRMIGERTDFSPDAQLLLNDGSAPTGDRVLFTVECDRPENWRQQVYSTYTGWGWRVVPTRSARGRLQRDTWQFDPTPVSGFLPQGASTVTQTFHLQAPFSMALPGLFVPTATRAWVRRAWLSEAGTLYVVGYLRPGSTYQVVSLIPREGPAPRTGALPPLDPALRARYLQLPKELPWRVGNLARKVTAGARGPFEAAVALRAHLAARYPYTLAAPFVPWDRDFVDFFLFESKRGYCSHFASAMVVMCRTLGIPARLVTGFVAGAPTGQKDTYEVQVKDAHSWAEVYVEGRGWQSFDPTPPLEHEEKRKPMRELWAEGVGKVAALLAGLGQTARADRGLLSGLAAGLLLGGATLIGTRRRAWQAVRLRDRRATPRARAFFAYGQMLRWLGSWHAGRRAFQAHREHLNSLPPTWSRPLRPDAERVLDCYLRARYGRAGVTEAEAAEAERALERVWEALLAARRSQPRRA